MVGRAMVCAASSGKYLAAYTEAKLIRALIIAYPLTLITMTLPLIEFSLYQKFAQRLHGERKFFHIVSALPITNLASSLTVVALVSSSPASPKQFSISLSMLTGISFSLTNHLWISCHDHITF